MNTLIVGGLLLVGVIVLVILFFVARGGAEATPQGLAATPPPNANQAQSQAQTAASVPLAEAGPVSLPAISEPAPLTFDDESTSHTHGQMHELSYELQMLHQQAQEIERRLSVLNMMVEQIESSPNHHSGIAKDASDLSSSK